MSSIHLTLEADAGAFAVVFHAPFRRAITVGPAPGDGSISPLPHPNQAPATDQRASTPAQARPLTDRALLEHELGTADAAEIVARVRHLEERLADHHQAQEASEAAGEVEPADPDAETAPDATRSSGHGSDDSLPDAVHDVFGCADLEMQWNNVVEPLRAEEPKTATRVLRWVRKHRDEMLEAAATIDDALELEETLAIRYIKYKSTWIMLNTRLQYQVARHGTPNQCDFYRASLITSLIAALEAILPTHDVKQIEAFLAQPLQRSSVA